MRTCLLPRVVLVVACAGSLTAGCGERGGSDGKGNGQGDRRGAGGGAGAQQADSAMRAAMADSTT